MEPGCLKHFTGPARSGSWMQSNSVSRLRPRDGNGIQLDQHGHLGLAVMEIWTCKVSTSSDSWFVFRYGSFHRCSYGGLGSLLGQLRSRNNAELCNWMPTTKTVPQREWTLTYATMPYQLKFSSTTWEIQNCIGGHVTRSICIYIYMYSVKNLVTCVIPQFLHHVIYVVLASTYWRYRESGWLRQYHPKSKGSIEFGPAFFVGCRFDGI